MFELFYIERALQTLEKFPKVAGFIAAYVLASEIQGNVTKVKMLRSKNETELRVAETNLETERLRLETAKIEQANRTT